jgi:hypothetical protein
MVVHTCKPSQEAKRGGLWVPGPPVIHSETLSQKNFLVWLRKSSSFLVWNPRPCTVLPSSPHHPYCRHHQPAHQCASSCSHLHLSSFVYLLVDFTTSLTWKAPTHSSRRPSPREFLAYKVFQSAKLQILTFRNFHSMKLIHLTWNTKPWVCPDYKMETPSMKSL